MSKEKDFKDWEDWAKSVVDDLPESDPIPEATLNNPLRRALMSLDDDPDVTVERIR